MKHLVASLALLAALPLAQSASPAPAATVRGAITSNARTAGPDLPVYVAQYADYIHGFVWVDGKLYPICCIPDPVLDDVIAVRLDNSGFAVAQFIDSVDQTIVQFSEATGQVKTFSSVPGITGVAFDTHTANTYALTSSSLQRFASNGRRIASADTKVPYESMTVMTSRAGDSVGAFGQGYVTLFDAASLAMQGTLQLPKGTLPPGPTRIANAAGTFYLHADGDAHLIVIDPAFKPWKLSSIALRASNPLGLGADANGRLYVSVGGKLAAFTAAGKPVQTVLTGQPATADFTIAH